MERTSGHCNLIKRIYKMTKDNGGHVTAVTEWYDLMREM